jgi:hypothetical protein
MGIELDEQQYDGVCALFSICTLKVGRLQLLAELKEPFKQQYSTDIGLAAEELPFGDIFHLGRVVEKPYASTLAKR